ncbi:N-acetylmuramoyl-L-alanine amidase [Thermodesulfovibrionales bacterium]|nr:N-acetylmuramoyl-L-alanine amidase [Thermodesulfovibrionales bacterium]
MKQRGYRIQDFKIVVVCILFFSFYLSLPSIATASEEPTTVTILLEGHQDYISIVFSADEDHVQEAAVMLIGNNIHVRFRYRVAFRIDQKGLDMEREQRDTLKKDTTIDISDIVRITTGDYGCIIDVRDLYNMNVLRLLLPPTLVINAYIRRPHDKYLEEKDLVIPAIREDDIPFESFAIDAGHGGHDSGIRFGDILEEDITLALARGISAALDKKGKTAFLTRTDDYAVSIRKRVSLVNQSASDILISLHMTPNNEFIIHSMPLRLEMGRGGGICLRRKCDKQAANMVKAIEGIAIAKAVAQSLRDELGMNVRHEHLPIPIVALVDMPAILIEIPYCHEKFRHGEDIMNKLINAILKGIIG